MINRKIIDPPSPTGMPYALALREALDSGCDFYHTEQNIFACDRKQTQILPKTP